MPVADYIPSIGLEIHVHLKTRSKMFCGCATSYAEPPNTRTCPVCLGLPGALPVLNADAIAMTILTGQLLEATTPPVCKWDRKNYFYADMPKNYQISQYDLPLVVGGRIPVYGSCFPRDLREQPVAASDGVVRRIALTRIHLEEDAGKSVHAGSGSGIDFNRAGTPLMEIVTEPEVTGPDEAAALLSSLRQILMHAGVSDADLERGQMRCDVNISVRPKSTASLSPRIELKNLNSISAVRRAISFEIQRQCDDLDSGIVQSQQTRRWDDERGESFDMRGKEDAHDYRYFPDPDLRPLDTRAIADRVRSQLPEMPHEKRRRYVEQSGLTPYDADVITADPAATRFFESCAVGAASPKSIANWIINELLGRLNESGLSFAANPIEPGDLRELVGMVAAGSVTGSQAREIFGEMFAGGGGPAAIAKARGFDQLADVSAIAAFVDEAVAAQPEIAARLKAGESKLLNVIVGHVMKASRGKANPKSVAELVMKRLG